MTEHIPSEPGDFAPPPRPRRRTTIAVVAAIVLLVAAVVAAYRIGAAEPECPTEDSCVIDYRDGRWVVTPVVP